MTMTNELSNLLAAHPKRLAESGHTTGFITIQQDINPYEQTFEVADWKGDPLRLNVIISAILWLRLATDHKPSPLLQNE